MGQRGTMATKNTFLLKYPPNKHANKQEGLPTNLSKLSMAIKSDYPSHPIRVRLLYIQFEENN